MLELSKRALTGLDNIRNSTSDRISDNVKAMAEVTKEYTEGKMTYEDLKYKILCFQNFKGKLVSMRYRRPEEKPPDISAHDNASPRQKEINIRNKEFAKRLFLYRGKYGKAQFQNKNNYECLIEMREMFHKYGDYDKVNDIDEVLIGYKYFKDQWNIMCETLKSEKLFED